MEGAECPLVFLLKEGGELQALGRNRLWPAGSTKAGLESGPVARPECSPAPPYLEISVLSVTLQPRGRRSVSNDWQADFNPPLVIS